MCKSADFLPPLFFWNLTEQDARRGTANSRIFVRMLTNILLYLAAVLLWNGNCSYEYDCEPRDL